MANLPINDLAVRPRFIRASGAGSVGDPHTLVVDLHDATVVAEYNVVLTNANTEYSQALPTNTRRLCFRCRSSVAIRYAWFAGKVATPTAPYQTLQAGVDYAIDGVLLASGTLYFASGSAGAVVELEAWS